MESSLQEAQAATSLEHIQQWIASCKCDGKPLICFFVDQNLLNPDEYFRYIARSLRDDFSFMTLICGTEVQANIPGKTFHIEENDISELSGIDVILLMNWGSRHEFPKTSSVASFCHSFGAYEHYDYSGYVNLLKYCDAFFVTSEHIFADSEAIKNCHVNMIDPRFLHRSGTHFHYLPTGCPRVAAVWDRLKNGNAELDTLLYAPVGVYSNPGERRNQAFAFYGEQVVDSLLQEFPDYRILYRPCIAEWGVEAYEAIVRKFSGHPRFAVSRNTDHTPDFARAAVCITEYSNIGEVFALSTLRPEIARTFFAPHVEPKLIRTGLAQSPAGDITLAVRRALDMPKGFWREHIAKNYEGYVIHPAETVGRIRQCLLALAGRAQFPPCVEIPRNPQLPPWDQAYYLRQAFQDSKINVRLLCDWMSVFPDDAVPVALRLLAGMRGDDQLTIMGDGWVTEDILRLLREKGGFCCQQDSVYAHVPADTPLRLLKYGAARAEAEGKAVYAELLRNLQLS